MKLLAKSCYFVIWVDPDGEIEGCHAGEAICGLGSTGLCGWQR